LQGLGPASETLEHPTQRLVSTLPSPTPKSRGSIQWINAAVATNTTGIKTVALEKVACLTVLGSKLLTRVSTWVMVAADLTHALEEAGIVPVTTKVDLEVATVAADSGVADLWEEVVVVGTLAATPSM
jgi:hypothetical protein